MPRPNSAEVFIVSMPRCASLRAPCSYNHRSNMLNVRTHSMQHVDDFSMNMGNVDIPWDRQISHRVTLRPCPEGQGKGKDADSPLQKYIEYHPKRCPEVYKVRKLYLGLLRDLPPPRVVQDKWDREVKQDLEEHLRQATSMLPKSMRDEETITEPVLCMAGKKCSPASVVVAAGATCPEDPVALKPTVWIFCGSKKCKKKVEGIVRNLAYLNHFLDRFSMDPPYISLQAPWPAAGKRPSDAPLAVAKPPEISFAIQYPVSGWTNVCGAKARFTIQTSDGIVERYSTLGGMIVVGNSIFGLTSAHTIVNFILESSSKAFVDELDSADRYSLDSGSENETSSDSDLEISHTSIRSSQKATVVMSRPHTEVRSIEEVEEDIWVDLELPKVLAYMGHGTVTGDYSFPTLVPNTSDFALINLGPLQALSNKFQHPGREAVSDFIATSDLLSGEVWIIATCGNKPLEGYLLEGDASLMLRGKIMRTKKIQVALPGVPGLSGAWVIRGGKLCGCVYAAYDRSPYLHMIPAQSIFEDVAALLATSNVKVATLQDIRQHKSTPTHAASGDLIQGECSPVSMNDRFLSHNRSSSSSASRSRVASLSTQPTAVVSKSGVMADPNYPIQYDVQYGRYYHAVRPYCTEMVIP